MRVMDRSVLIEAELNIRLHAVSSEAVTGLVDGMAGCPMGAAVGD